MVEIVKILSLTTEPVQSNRLMPELRQGHTRPQRIGAEADLLLGKMQKQICQAASEPDITGERS